MDSEGAATILVVDDSVFHRELARTLLAREGYVVRQATDVVSALVEVTEQPPDLVLMEVMLPGDDGYSLCRRLKENPGTRNIPILLVTALGKVTDKVRGLEAGADDCMTKPYNRAELAARVRSLVRAKRMSDQLESWYRQVEMKNRALEQELKVAREVQQRLLPLQTPVIEGIELQALYRSSSEVGGDFYDFRVFDTRRFGVMVADVEGHGAPAALVTALIKVIFQNLTREYRPPHWLMTQMNREIIGLISQSFTGPSVTAVYAVFDLAAGQVQICRGGHPPVALRRADGRAHLVDGDGFPLGWFTEAPYESVTVSLAEGDTMLFYTDGLYEVLGRDDGAGLSQVEELLRASVTGRGLMQCVAERLARLEEKGSQTDDVAVIAAHVTRLPQRHGRKTKAPAKEGAR